MDKRFILLSYDKHIDELFDNVVLRYLREHGELFGPFYPSVDRNLTAPLSRLDKQYDSYIFLDERFYGTDCHETVEFIRTFSPSLNHLVFYDIGRQQLTYGGDVNFQFSNNGLDMLFEHVSKVCAYDE